MPCDHFSIQVPASKFEDLISFLTKSLSQFGFKELMRPVPNVVGMGETVPYLWIAGAIPDGADIETVDMMLRASHVAFSAAKRSQVDEVYKAAINAGAVCNGPPGIRANYHPNYYAAFVRDPVVGINFEVVCHCSGDEAVNS